MNTTTSPIADDYLSELRRAASALPRAKRRELMEEVSAHVDAAVAEAGSEVELRNLLDDLGDPDEIVASAEPPGRSTSPSPVLAVVLGVLGVVFAAFPPVGLPLAIAGIVVGWRVLRRARQQDAPTLWAAVAIVIASVGVVISLVVLVSFSLLWGSSASPGDEGSPSQPAEVSTTTVGR